MERSEIAAWAAAACLQLVDDGFMFTFRCERTDLVIDLHKDGRSIRRIMPWEMLEQATHPRSIVENMINTASKFVEAALATEPTIN